MSTSKRKNMSRVSIEDFMTPAEFAQNIERDMAERTDELLVLANIEPKRKERLCGGGSNGLGMMIRLKEPTRVKFKVEIYPNETEEPHFKVVYQNESCRFKIVDCSPMKAEAERGIPTQINKIMKHIKQAWSENNEELIKLWQKTRPSDRNLMHQQIQRIR